MYREKDKAKAQDILENLIQDIFKVKKSSFKKMGKYPFKMEGAKVEGKNNLIKHLKKISFGFKDVRVYIRKIILGLLKEEEVVEFLTSS